MFEQIMNLLLKSFLSVRQVMQIIMLGDICSVWDLSIALLIIAVLLSVLLSFVDLSQFHTNVVGSIDKPLRDKERQRRYDVRKSENRNYNERMYNKHRAENRAYYMSHGGKR